MTIIKGSCFGVKITEREKGQSDLVTILVEDDGEWNEKETIAAYWLPDLIDVLMKAQRTADCSIIYPGKTEAVTFQPKK